jgi:hypothetical protein
MRNWREWATTQGTSVGEQWSGLTSLVERKVRSVPETIAPFVDALRKSHKEEISSILFYGSCLFSSTQRQSSFPDFYVLVSSLGRYHRSPWHATLNRILPPNVYYGDFSSGAQSLRCKYCVMSLDQFERETSHRAHDIHHLGRFSKQFCMAYSRDAATAQAIVDSALRAMLILVPHSLALLPERFSLEEFVLMQLGLSYLGERRVVEPTKVNSLLDASRDYYLAIYSAVLSLYFLRYGTPVPTGESAFSKRRASAEQRQHTESFLQRSRTRGIFRWPKYILTVDNWLQYILDKLERHQGIKVELTGLQRKYPLIFGWPVYFELRRKGIVK